MKPFCVVADEIRYENRTVGYLSPNLNPTFYDRVQESLESALDSDSQSELWSNEDVDALKDEHAVELEDVEAERDEMEIERDKLAEIVDKIEDGADLLAQLEDMRKDRDTWREAALKIRELYDEQSLTLSLARKRKPK